MKKNRFKILFAASEAVPFSKSGGLGDACGFLPKAFKRRGHDIRLVLPRYWCVNHDQYKLKKLISPMGVPMGNTTAWCEVYETLFEGIPVYFIEHENYFGRAGLYDDGKREYWDNAARFGFFSHACIQLCKDLNFKPDIIHSHDWQTALVSPYLKIWEPYNPFFEKTASVFSIHNVAYQGKFPAEFFPFLGLGHDNFTEAKFEDCQMVNFMKGAIFYADAISTVSPSYAHEILSNPGANGLAPYLERRREDVYGILNGIDYDVWNPETDKLIPANFSVRDFSGKAVCKRELQKEFWLEASARIPVIGAVSRFHHQKGFHLLLPIIKSVVRDMKVQFVFVGSGEKWLEDFFGGLPAEFPGRIGAWIGYNEKKSHLVESGADFFLMPSLYEPCGLNQIYSMKYGTLPIVRSTGGLKDTVRQYQEATGRGTGFCYDDPDPKAIYNTIGWAVSTFYDRPQHIQNMRQEAMQCHFSWDDSAEQYETVYENALRRRLQWRI